MVNFKKLGELFSGTAKVEKKAAQNAINAAPVNSQIVVKSADNVPVMTFSKEAATSESLSKALRTAGTGSTVEVKSVDGLTVLSKSTANANEALTKVAETTAKAATSPLKTAAKIGGGVLAGAGVTYLATSAATATPNPDIINPLDDDGDGNPDTYYYITDNEGVNEALGFIQTQIDDIVSFLTDLVDTLFGGGTTDGGGAGSGTDSGGFDIDTGLYPAGTTGNGGLSPIKIIAFVILIVIIAVLISKKLKKGKRSGKK